MCKKDICFIRAKQRGEDYFFRAMEEMEYDILIPYKDVNLFFRCFREMWFLIGLPGRKIWFNKKILKKNPKIFIIKDPLVVPEFLQWMKKQYPKTRIILDYDNRVSMSINPGLVNENVAEKWSYDADDCQKYGMKLKHGAYLDIYSVKQNKIFKYDILYLGRDKGRVAELFNIEKKFNDLGLKTFFYICADRSYMKYRKKFYKPYLAYSEYLSLLQKSKAILNIVQPGQRSVTMREYEAVFDNVKCITNNPGILNFELYHSSRYFVLNVDNIEELVHFIHSPFIPVEKELLKKYTFEAALHRMIEVC